jgi:hypothetical protein
MLPFKVSLPAAAPKLALAFTASSPALTVVPPVCVLTPVSVRSPAPCLTKGLMPRTTPDSVNAKPLVSIFALLTSVLTAFISTKSLAAA